MSISIIVSTHGQTSEEMINSAEMIVGKQTNIGSVPFNFGDNIEDLEDKINSLLKSFHNSDGVLILVDLKGGSPYNVSSQIALKNPRVELVSGVNLPSLIEAIISRDSLNLEELAESVVAIGKDGIEKLIKDIEDEDEDF